MLLLFTSQAEIIYTQVTYTMASAEASLRARKQLGGGGHKGSLPSWPISLGLLLEPGPLLSYCHLGAKGQRYISLHHSAFNYIEHTEWDGNTNQGTVDSGGGGGALAVGGSFKWYLGCETGPHSIKRSSSKERADRVREGRGHSKLRVLT